MNSKDEMIPVREIVTYRYNDMMIYVTMTAFIIMAIIFCLILSL